MKEKQKNKLGLGIIIGVLIGFILGLCCFITYDKLIVKDKNDTTIENNNSEIADTKVNNNIIKPEDNYALEVSNNKINLYLLNNGNLYYKSVESSYIMTFDNIDEYSHDEDFTNKNLIKFNGIDNIVRIKGTNTISTGEAFNILLITKDGSVYSYVAGNDSAIKIDLFEKYKVDDIIKYNPVAGCLNDGTDPNFKTCGATFEIITQDGKTVSGTLNTDGTIIEK